jgi:hypothetical protein
VKKEERAASLKQGFDEMPSHEAFTSPQPSRAKTCVHWLVSAAPWLAMLLAYVWAQATVRGIESMAEFLLHVHTACLDSPQLVVGLLRRSIGGTSGGRLPPLPTAKEWLNVVGGTAALFCAHVLMRAVLVKLVQRSRRTGTLFDDVAFGVCLIMFPRAHVIFDPADLNLSSETGQHRSRSERLPLTLRFASVGDDTVRTQTNDDCIFSLSTRELN